MFGTSSPATKDTSIIASASSGAKRGEKRKQKINPIPHSLGASQFSCLECHRLHNADRSNPSAAHASVMRGDVELPSSGGKTNKKNALRDGVLGV
ncbi:hypothetical protein BaRGS_00007123 [Batillaria attramentaria]|uniref:Uncharacterized protein n=1 Tax=Batillaria attramentaria TaxID=370345 RepID=A0ABD0LQG2_9CAEN